MEKRMLHGDMQQKGKRGRCIGKEKGSQLLEFERRKKRKKSLFCGDEIPL